MRGTLLSYNSRNGEGLISGADNNRYVFKGINVKSDFNLLRDGSLLDFDIEGDEAVSIYILAPQPSSGININLGEVGGKSKIVAGLLAIFFGGFGIHKFYLGYTRSGVIMLLVTVLGFILLGIPSLVMCIIALIEGVVYLTKSDEDFYQTYVAHQREWF